MNSCLAERKDCFFPEVGEERSAKAKAKVRAALDAIVYVRLTLLGLGLAMDKPWPGLEGPCDLESARAVLWEEGSGWEEGVTWADELEKCGRSLQEAFR